MQEIFDLVQSGSFKLLGDYIDRVGDPDIMFETTETALYRVSKNIVTDPKKDSEMVKFLISKGADILWKHEVAGSSPAAHIIRCDDDDLVDFMLSKLPHINVSVDQDENTCLHHAVRYGKDKTVRTLLKRAANPNQKNKDGYSSLHEAVLSKDGHKVLKLLVENGADINMSTGGGMTPLHLVSFTQGDKRTLFSVLECQPILEQKDSFGRTPLTSFATLMRESLDEIAMLLDSGSDANVKNCRGLNLLHEMAAENFTEGIKNVARLLIESGININEKTLFEENTPMHLATLHDNPRFAEYLVANHADLCAENVKGETPFDMAIMANRTNVVTSMIAYAVLNEIPEEKLMKKSGVEKIARNSFMGFIIQTCIDSCKNDIELLKKSPLQFYPKVNLHDILVMEEKDLVDMMKNTEVNLSLEIELHYGGTGHFQLMLQEKVLRARRCRTAKDEILEHLYKSSSQPIPRICMERIAYHIDPKFSLQLQRQISNYAENVRNDSEAGEN